MEQQDIEIVDRVIRHEEGAFDRLYLRYKDEAYRTAVFLTENVADAQDVVQDTFVSVSLQIDKLRDKEAFEGWFYRILTRNALQYLKKRKKEVPTEEAAIKEKAQAGLSADALEMLCKKEEQKFIRELLKKMNEKYRTVLVLYYYNGFSVAEIADITGEATGTVKSKLHYARKQLEKKLREAERGNRMKKQELDDTIRNLFKEEAANLEAPDAIKEAIDRRLADASANKETLGNIQGFPTGQGRARRGRKRVMVVLVAVFVLLFSSITGSGTANVVEIRGYSYVEPDTREFIELPELMKTAGYDFIPVEQFSNGYAFDCVHLSYAQKMDVNENPVGEPFYTMRLAYVKDGREVELSVNRVEQKFEPIPERIVETFEVNGVTIYLMKSVYFMLPENWEELITEGQRATLEGPLGNYGVFSDQETIEMQTNYAYQWEQNGYHYVLGEFLTGGEDLIEDEKVIAREWVEVN